MSALSLNSEALISIVSLEVFIRSAEKSNRILSLPFISVLAVSITFCSVLLSCLHELQESPKVRISKNKNCLVIFGIVLQLHITVAGLAKVAIFTIPIAIGSDAENHFD